ncbi:MAG: hypothetical protein L0Z68_08455 [Gammaproteobacteria bacterium]|nr:hypothetical protein [Gammaproteobacteria bacterium]
MAPQVSFSVHRISPNYKPRKPPKEATHSLLFRDRRDKVAYIELNLAAARLLELIQEMTGWPGRELLDTIAQELQHRKPELLIDSGLESMRELRAKDVLLGVRVA